MSGSVILLICPFLTFLSHICSGLLPMLYRMDRKPDWNVFLNILDPSPNTTPLRYLSPEIVRSLNLGNVWVFVQLIFFLDGIPISCMKTKTLSNTRLLTTSAYHFCLAECVGL